MDDSKNPSGTDFQKMSVSASAPLDSSAELTEDRIERYYFKQILNGEMVSGTRMPSNRELAAHWGTSCSTVQRALNKLVAAGCIDRTPRRGTFVRHKANRAFLGILFGPSLINETASHYRLLNAALISELDSEFLSCRSYDNLGTSRLTELDTILAHLRADQKSFDFRGYVCVTSVPDTVPIDQLIPLDAPRVMSDRNQPGNDIVFDYYDFGVEIVKTLYAQNAQRLCCMGFPSVDNQLAFDAVRATAAACGLPDPIIYQPNVHPQPEIEVGAYHDTLAWLDQYKDQTLLPDAIIISDDIAARGVIFALLNRGLRVPEDIRLGILGNEGVNIFYSAPVTRYDYPIRAVGKQLADLLKLRMANRPTPAEPIVIKGTLSEGF